MNLHVPPVKEEETEFPHLREALDGDALRQLT
jgi:hypothetical protein